ncbi:hypothetical protein C900_02457 [Fulvivirga imtechensis AK7]|uniref:Uncharacterized protein n=2 Tax=Fulvivirga TaxID=396811 RepID=L8JWE5_9BACT|nr:hypothetical protein C900_02457 [Fulvivirga imtechensis AK7]
MAPLLNGLPAILPSKRYFLGPYQRHDYQAKLPIYNRLPFSDSNDLAE